jgi:hypothetical protein
MFNERSFSRSFRASVAVASRLCRAWFSVVSEKVSGQMFPLLAEVGARNGAMAGIFFGKRYLIDNI